MKYLALLKTSKYPLMIWKDPFIYFINNNLQSQKKSLDAKFP